MLSISAPFPGHIDRLILSKKQVLCKSCYKPVNTLKNTVPARTSPLESSGSLAVLRFHQCGLAASRQKAPNRAGKPLCSVQPRNIHRILPQNSVGEMPDGPFALCSTAARNAAGGFVPRHFRYAVCFGNSPPQPGHGIYLTIYPAVNPPDSGQV